MHGQNVKFPIAFAQPRTQARERKLRTAHGGLDARLESCERKLRTFEEHWKRQIQDPRNIEHLSLFPGLFKNLNSLKSQ